MSKWKPIETVPKIHGLEILVCQPGRTMAVVQWLDKEVISDEVLFVSGWYVWDGKIDPIRYRNWPYVTHWMPLPEPPK